MKLLYAFLVFACVSVSCEASRIKQSVEFNLENDTKNAQILPFSAQVPADFRGSFVRFINPKNGKSVVTRIVKRTGEAYRANPELMQLIDIDSTIAIVFVEAVY